MPALLDRSLRPLRVLIVEDESRLRDLLMDVIPDLGFPAFSARSAEEALKIMESEACDIIVLDLRLPMMGGMDFFEIVRARWPLMQVIILTGFGDIETARRAIHLDVADFLSKPCHLKDIEIALDRARKRSSSALPSIDFEESLEIVESVDGGESNLTLAESEKRQILAALARNNGNRSATAAELGISRRTLHYRLQQYRQRD